MKKTIIIFFAAMFATKAFACDICGCGVGSYYIGILPEFKKRFIGFRYQHKGLYTHVAPDGSYTYLTSKETYQTLELWGAVNLGKKFRIMGFVPINFNERKNATEHNNKNGLGDIAIVGYYNVLNHNSQLGKNRLVQQLWVGAGIKLPTGKYDPNDKNITQNAQNTFQLGTGSVDFTFNGMYDIRLQDVGINLNASYKINTENEYSYQYGNKFTLNSLVYYKIKVNPSITVAPNAGILYEHAADDWKDNNIKVDESGGYSTMALFGAECSFKNMGLGGNFQTPLAQNLAHGHIEAKNRFMLHVSISF